MIETKNHTDHTLPLSHYLFDTLAVRKANAVNQYVFPNEFGTGMLNDPKKQIQKVVQESGVSFTLHDFRRKFITDVECLRIPMQKIADFITGQFGIKVSADVIPLQRQG